MYQKQNTSNHDLACVLAHFHNTYSMKEKVSFNSFKKIIYHPRCLSLRPYIYIYIV